MKFKIVLQIAVSLAFALPVFAKDIILYVEVRCQATNEIISSTDKYSVLDFATESTIDGGPLSLTKQRRDGEFKVFQQSYDLLSKDRRRAIIVSPWNQVDQLFLLPISPKPKPTGWTTWQRPNCVEKNADGNFNDGYTPPDRSTNIPSNSFEMRYKIE